MEFTAIVQHFYPNREKYLPIIFRAIQQAKPKEIILWNNANTDLKYEGVTVIRSSRNTLLGRYASALLSETALLYVQDDDLLVSADVICQMVRQAIAKPQTIIGLTGSNPARMNPEPYTKGHAVDGRCDIALGRSWACNKHALASGIQYCLSHNLNPGRCDDILFSMVNPGRAFSVQGRYTNFDEEGVGLSHMPEHYSERNAFVSRLLKEGY